MKLVRYFHFILVLIMFSVTANSNKLGPVYDLEDAPKLFDEFIELYQRGYTGEERKRKYEVFYQNLVEINKINRDDSLTRIAEINEETDLTAEEKRKLYKLHDSVGRQRG